MSHAAFSIMLALLPIALGLLLVLLILRGSLKSPHNLRRYQTVTGWLLTPLLLYFAYSAWLEGRMLHVATTSAGAILIFLSAILIPALRGRSNQDARRDYKADPHHCGACGYDLRQRSSPTCPECGWEIPTDLRQIESRTWAFW